jgi:transglutaminase-like putative cysteine protease
VKYRVRHLTTYKYTEPVQLSHHAAHLRPRLVNGQAVSDVTLSIRPEPAVLHDGQVDYFGNPTTFFTIQSPHKALVIEAAFTVETSLQPLLRQMDSVAWDAVRLDGSAAEEQVMDYRFASSQVPLLAEAAQYAAASFPPGRPLVEAVLDLTRRIHADFTFDPKATSVGTPVQVVFEERRGVCQDFAHIGIACLRAMGLAARYVSGYIRTIAPPGQAKMIGADASHAWLAVYVPGWGWLDLDPTNNMAAGPDHITVAWGRDYDDVSPVRGVVLGGGDHEVHVAVDVLEI